MRRITDKLLYTLINSLGKLLAILPLRVLYILSDALYPLVFYILKYRKKIVLDNLQIAFPEKTDAERLAIAKKFYRHFCDILVEIIKLFHISSEEMKKRMKWVNTDLIDENFAQGKHALVVAGHYNNWEWGIGLGIGLKYIFAGIYKPLSSRIFDKVMIDFRTQFGGVPVPMAQTVRYLVQNIKDEKLTMINFIADQSPMRHETQYWVDFFNRKTAVYLGIEKLAQKTKQPVYYLHLNKVKRGYYTAELEKICDDASLLQPYELTDTHTKILERHIREYPEFWLWSHRRWKVKPL